MPRVSPWLLRTLQIVACVAIAVLLWRTVDGWEALSLIGSADPKWLVAAGVALTAQTIASALRWRITAAQLGIDIPAPEAIREYYLSQVVNQSLPGGVVGDAARAVRARGQAGLVASGQAVVFERLAGQIGLLALLAIGLALGVVVPNAPDWPMAVLVPTVVALTLVTSLLIGIVLRPSSPRDTSLNRTLNALTHALFAPQVRGLQIALSLLTASCNIAAFAFCASALGVTLPISTALTLIPLILFAMVLPLSISGWGLREGAAVVLFPIAGASAELGLATSVAFGLVFLASVVPGLIVSWMRPIAPVTGR